MDGNERNSDGLWPSARWGEALVDPLTGDVIWSRVAEGETLAEVCRSRGWPRSMVVRWIEGDVGRRAAYEFALRVWADGLAQETIGIADAGEDVTRDKLRVDTRLKLAGKWDRERYGDRVDVKQTGNITVEVVRYEDLPVINGSHTDVTPVSESVNQG